jgi:hypothetical protein
MKKNSFLTLSVMVIALFVSACDIGGTQDIDNWGVDTCSVHADCQQNLACVIDQKRTDEEGMLYQRCANTCEIKRVIDTTFGDELESSDSCQRNDYVPGSAYDGSWRCANVQVSDSYIDTSGNLVEIANGSCLPSSGSNSGGDTDTDTTDTVDNEPGPNPIGETIWCRFYIPSNVNASTLIGDKVFALWHAGGPVDPVDRSSVAELLPLGVWTELSLSLQCLWNRYDGTHPYFRYNLTNCTRPEDCVRPVYGDGDKLEVQCDLPGSITYHFRGLGQTDAELPYTCGL